MNQTEAVAALTGLVAGVKFPHEAFMGGHPVYCWTTSIQVLGGTQFHVTTGINGFNGLATGLIMRFFPVEPQDAPEAGRIILNENEQGDIILPNAKYRIDFIAPEPLPESEPAPIE